MIHCFSSGLGFNRLWKYNWLWNRNALSLSSVPSKRDGGYMKVHWGKWTELGWCTWCFIHLWWRWSILSCNGGVDRSNCSYDFFFFFIKEQADKSRKWISIRNNKQPEARRSTNCNIGVIQKHEPGNRSKLRIGESQHRTEHLVQRLHSLNT